MNENKPEYNEPEIVTVGQFEWKIVEGNVIAETTGMGPCFGVVIYDPEIKKAIIGHFPEPDMTSDFEQMIEEAKKLFNDIKRIDVYLGGGGPLSNSRRDIKHCKKNRKFVEYTLKSNGFKNLKINYNDSTDNTVLRVNTESGKIDYDIQDEENESEYNQD